MSSNEQDLADAFQAMLPDHADIANLMNRVADYQAKMQAGNEMAPFTADHVLVGNCLFMLRVFMLALAYIRRGVSDTDAIALAFRFASGIDSKDPS